MRLTIVGLPLGNIQDIGLRAIKVLAEATVVICEDTRVFLKLWQKLVNLDLLKGPFAGKLLVLNEFNERSKAEELAGQIKEYDKEVILVTDAGMPTVSDPGYRLVKRLLEMEVKITVVPGPTAAMTALAGSGFSADRVFYLGFLPKKQSKRELIWEEIKNFKEGVTVVIYESPTRVAATLREVVENFGEATPVVVARELTKEHEEWLRGTAKELVEKTKSLKGEVAILFRKN